MNTDRSAPLRAWKPLARPAAGQVHLLRPAVIVLLAALALFIAWSFPQHPDPYSSRWAGKAAFVAWTMPPAAAVLAAMAVGRVLVSMRVVAALYGRVGEQVVEVTGYAGRFGWVFSRRRLVPGRVLLEVAAVGPGVLHGHLIRLSQGPTQVTVWADGPWDDATVPGIIAWLGEHGIEVVVLGPPT